jgi:hypothetical protein
MMGASLIRSISDYQAYEAAQEGKEPLSLWKPEDVHHIPFLGPYVPAGWRRALWADVPIKPSNVYQPRDDENADFMADKTGMGAENEPALTMTQLQNYAAALVAEEFGWTVIEEGQFQVVIGLYVADSEAKGTEAPEPDPCEYCKSIHGPMDECGEHECEGKTEDIADGVVGNGAAHVYRCYCTICGTEMDEADA